MTEWGVVGVLIALVGLVSAIVAPIIKLNTTITRLAAIVESLQKQQESQIEKASESHRRLWEHNETQDRELADHEARIGILEETRFGSEQRKER